MRRILSRVSLAFLLVAAWGPGCAKDRNLEDWKQQKLGEEMAKLQEIAGTYSGTVSSKKDGSPMGTLALRLEASTRVIERSDGSRADQIPVLRGKFHFSGKAQGVLSFRDGYYDPHLKDFKVTVSAPTVAGEIPVLIDVHGRLEGDRLVGAIEAFDYPEEGGSFSLIRSVGELPSADLGRAIPGESLAAPEVYEGEARWGVGYSVPATLVVVRQNRTTEQQLIDLFVPVRKLAVTLSFGGEGVQTHFSPAQWDDRVGELRGKTQVNTSGGLSELTLICKQSLDDSQVAVLICDYISNLQGTLTRILFRPKGGATAEPKVRPGSIESASAMEFEGGAE